MYISNFKNIRHLKLTGIIMQKSVKHTLDNYYCASEWEKSKINLHIVKFKMNLR